jgi:hypothetical protein
VSAKAHQDRKHSKFSASGSERWFNCPGSVALSEGLPDVDSKWSIEGTKAHEVLEDVFEAARVVGATKIDHVSFPRSVPHEMIQHALRTANFVLGLHTRTKHSELLVETRIKLSFIHPEMFGTFDSGVVDYFGTLNVFDYKYGAGHSVSPGTIAKPNLQMLFYGIGLAYLYAWNFKQVRLWIDQPRVKGYDGPLFLEMPIKTLKGNVRQFQEAVERVEDNPSLYREGSWCHWCKAKKLCPMKQEKRLDRSRAAFLASPLKPIKR